MRVIDFANLKSRIRYIKSGLRGIENNLTELEIMVRREAEYVAVVSLCAEEIEKYGGDPKYIQDIADKVGENLMELGYWDVLEQTIEEGGFKK